jgi:hypothetical protein
MLARPWFRATLLILFLLFGPTSAQATLCAVDDVPAATLLLPYFEVDLNPEQLGGETTLFSVVNTSPEPTLVKAVLWTDMGLPTLDFEIYLTGFDVFTSNLRDLFVLGRVPVTGPTDSPQGFDALPNTPFPDCGATSFGGSLAPGLLDSLVKAHTGQPSNLFGGLCGAVPPSRLPAKADKARGFLTLDVVRRCSVLDPTQAGYFGPQGVAGYDNRLIGDFFFVDQANDFAQGEQLVRLEASTTDFEAGDRTFYAPFVGGDGSDGREPLPTVWASRYLQGGGFDGGTQILVWRGLSKPGQPFACDTVDRLPPMTEIYAFDEEENGYVVFPITGPLPPLPSESQNPLPFAAVRGSSDFLFGLFPDFGWMTFDMGTSEVPVPHSEIEDVDPFSQAWIGSTFDASGRYSVGMGGSPLSSPCGLGGCVRGQAVTVEKLCFFSVHPVNSGVDTVVSAGDFPLFEISTGLCRDDPALRVYQNLCWANDGSDFTLTVETRQCAAGNPASPPPDPCQFRFETSCHSLKPLVNGTYTVRLGGLSLQFQVPSVIPVQGLCVTAPG